jgi:hypothetical protein
MQLTSDTLKINISDQSAWPGIQSIMQPMEFEITEVVDGVLDDNVGEYTLDDSVSDGDY